MKNILIIAILTISTLSSCFKPIKEYQLDNDVQHITLKLYADSTFTELIDEIEDSYEYSGNWTGNLKEGSTFTTVATKKGLQIITLTPTKTYRIENGKATQIEKQDESKELVNEFKEDTTITVEWLGLSCFCPNWIEIEHLKELKNDALGIMKDKFSISILPSDPTHNIYNNQNVGNQTPLVFKLKGRFYRNKIRHEAKGMLYESRTFQYDDYEMIEY